jgi:hypothetical protein
MSQLGHDLSWNADDLPLEVLDRVAAATRGYELGQSARVIYSGARSPVKNHERWLVQRQFRDRQPSRRRLQGKKRT